MLDSRSITGQYIGIFLFGCFLFCYPVLTLFNLPSFIFGIPLFFFYLFTAWAVLIVSIILCGKLPEPYYPSESDPDGDSIKLSD